MNYEIITTFIFAVLTLLSVIISFKTTTKENIKGKKLLIPIVIISSAIITVLFYLNIAIIKNIYTLICFIYVFKYISSKNLYEVTYYAILIWIYGFILETIIMLIVSILGLDNLLLSLNIILVRIISNIVVTCLLLGLMSIPVFQNFTNKTVGKLIKIKKSNILEIIFILFLILTHALCVFYIKYISLQLIALILISLLLFLIYNIIDKNYKLKKLKEVNDILIKNNEFFLKMDEDYRKLKHNLTSQLMGIKTVSNDDSKILIDELIKNYNSKFVSSQDIVKIPQGINGLVYEKLYSFQKQDIKLAVENSLKCNIFEAIKPKIYNKLCETLGVLIDNALEATDDSEEKSILIDFSENKDYIIVNVINTFSNIIDLDKLGEKEYTTKTTGHGIGLFSIFSKTDLKIRNYIVNNLFQTEIKIKKVLI